MLWWIMDIRDGSMNIREDPWILGRIINIRE